MSSPFHNDFPIVVIGSTRHQDYYYAVHNSAELTNAYFAIIKNWHAEGYIFEDASHEGITDDEREVMAFSEETIATMPRILSADIQERRYEIQVRMERAEKAQQEYQETLLIAEAKNLGEVAQIFLDRAEKVIEEIINRLTWDSSGLSVRHERMLPLPE